jgi:sugar lactone lactonase YvrE
VAYSTAIAAKDAIYFADAGRKTIGYIDAGGKTGTVYSGGKIALPSSVALSPDQGMLIVADAQARFAWSFQIAPDGGLIDGEPFQSPGRVAQILNPPEH